MGSTLGVAVVGACCTQVVIDDTADDIVDAIREGLCDGYGDGEQVKREDIPARSKALNIKYRHVEQ